ncbi:hypothetical protein BG004_005589 [Podila humilis]|nr:hypothetical protein BG004_005589 [Podila humilis]
MEVDRTHDIALPNHSHPRKKASMPQLSRKVIDMLSQLPTELAFVILYQVPYRSLVAMTRVNRYWRALILHHDCDFWHRLCQKHGYISVPTDTPCASPPPSSLPVPSYSARHSHSHSHRHPDLGEAVRMRPGLTRALEQSMNKVQARALSVASSSSSPSSSRLSSQPLSISSSPSSPSPSLSALSSSSSSSSSSPSLSTPSSSSPISTLSSSSPTPTPTLSAPCAHTIDTWRRLFEISAILEAEWKAGKPTIKELRGHQDPVLCVKILPLWDRVVTGDRSGCLKIWSATTGVCLRTFRQHRMGISSLVFQKNILISGSWEGTIIIWKQIQEAPYLKPQKLVELGEQVSSMYLNERMELAFGTLSGRVKIVSLVTISSLGTFVGPAGNYCNAVFLSDSKLEAAFGTQYISWDLTTKAPIGFISDAHFDNISCMQVDESRKLIFTASQDSKVRMFSRDNKPMLLRQYGGHRASVRCMTIRDNIVITGSADKTVMLTFLEPNDYLNKDAVLYTALSDTLETTKAAELNLCQSDAEPMASDKKSNSERMQEADSDEHLGVAEPVSLTHAAPVGAVDADCSLLVSGSEDGTVRFFYFGDDLWCPPSAPSPRLCGQASLVSLAAPRCVLMMKPGRTRVSVGNRRQTWGTCALSVLERARVIVTEQDLSGVMWMTVDEIYQRMVEWDMQPVR